MCLSLQSFQRFFNTQMCLPIIEKSSINKSFLYLTFQGKSLHIDKSETKNPVQCVRTKIVMIP